jgi:hypothetical protein
MPDPEPEPLRLLDKEEWWNVCSPDLTREDYDRAWDEFQAMKARKELQ